MTGAGWLVALLPVLSPVGPRRNGLAKALKPLVQNKALHILSSAQRTRTRLGLGFHLLPFLGEPDRLPKLACDHAILRVDQSWHQPAHQRICPFETILTRAHQFFGKPVELAPISDQIEWPSLNKTVPHRPAIDPADLSTLDRIGNGSVSNSNRNASITSQANLISNARVLMLSPNGIGMGHLTRQLAIARQMPKAIDPIFVSMSQAVSVTESYGFHYEYMPGPHAVGVEEDRWVPDFCQRLVDAVGFYDARALVFDGNFPYYALEMARDVIAERPMIWLRRGLWRKDAGRPALKRGAIFDLVIEPDDFARTMDIGPTSTAKDSERVAPIILMPPAQLLERKQAREMLGLPDDATAILIQLGSGNNFAMDEVNKTILDYCSRHSDLHARCVRWLISANKDNPCAGYSDRFRQLRGFPLSRFLNAFDFAISAAGYNSFHELLSARLPTIFVPNENPIMDEQEARALYAERLGAAFYAPAHDPTRMVWALSQLSDAGQREHMRERMVALPKADGARQAASMIALQAFSINATRKSARIPRYLSRW